MGSLETGSSSVTMIRVSGNHARRSVELLGQDDANETVRQRHCRDREPIRGGPLEPFIQAVGAADHERHACVVGAPLLQSARDIAGRPSLSAFVERDDAIIWT